MNTPAHLIFGLTAFGRPDKPKVTAAALVGSLLPDLSLYLMSGWHLLVLGTDPNVVFDELYFSESWQTVFRIDNSFVLWGIALALALLAKSRVAIAFTGSIMLHLLFDFPLHHDDARAHFWPITTWIFESPVSYWDPKHYGNIAGALEILLSLGACGFLLRRFPKKGMRILIIGLGLAELLPGIAFALMQHGHGP